MSLIGSRDMDDMFADPELIDLRTDERLDLARLEPYLRANLPLADGPIMVRQFGGGHANLTYLIRFGEAEYVLRRPPLGLIAPSSHDMQREYRVLSKLYRVFALAPRSYLYCDDAGIIGAPFQVMERRHGVVIRETMPSRFDADRALNRRIGEMLVDVLADFHRIDREAAGLADLGHPPGFVKRQMDGWTRRWQAAGDEHNPAMRRLTTWLCEHLPESREASLLHNDFKLDNLIVDADDPSRPIAILDWDMCTSGDPLMDLGYLLNQWVEADDDREWIESAAMPTWQPGFPTRAEVVKRYAKRTDFSVSEVDWYYAFSTMKFAVIIQQIYIRYVRGQTADRRFAHYDRRVAAFIDKGLDIAKA